MLINYSKLINNFKFVTNSISGFKLIYPFYIKKNKTYTLNNNP